MKKLTQRGFSPIEIGLIVVIVGLIGGLGYYVYQKGKASPNQEESTTQSQTNKTETPAQKSTAKDYENKELGFKLSYPESWGEATLKDGEIVSPGQGGYKQLVFSKHAELDINFVQKGFMSPLDGCPKPLYAEKHDLSAQRASVIGWSGDTLKRYYQDRQSDETKYVVMTTASTDENGWEKLSVDGQVLEYKDKSKYSYAVEPEGCNPDVTQKEVDEANAYRKYIRYALNFSNGTVVGVNAQYDARQNDNPSVRKELIKVLNSISKK